VNEEIVPGLRYSSGAQELWALVIASFGGWEERMNAVAADVALSPVSAWALVQIDPDHPISQKELAARLRCNPSTVVDPTDRLEDAGLVVRQAHAVDRRINVLVITPKGKKVRDEVIERLFEPPEAFRRLAADDQALFRDVMVEALSSTRALDDERLGARKHRRS
jgi:DNA-binding MarR family transcriptional regulator